MPKNRKRADRSKVARSQTYEIAYFARKHGITKGMAYLLIEIVGNDRSKLNAAVKRLQRTRRP